MNDTVLVTEHDEKPAPSSGLPAEALEAFGGDPNFMASLARGLTVLVAFGQQKRALTVAQLSHRTGLSRAAVRRCMYTLAKLGFATTDDDRHFALTPKILLIGHAYLSSSPLVTLAQPLLDRVSAEVHETSSVGTLEGDEILYVARSKTATRLMSIDLRVGSRLPAYCTSIGRVLLAALPPDELDAYLARVKLVQRTPKAVHTPEKLREILDHVRSSGHAVIDQELEVGLRSIAVPVRDPRGKVIAAMNVGAPSAHINVADLESRVFPVLRQAAIELGSQLP